MVENKPGAQGTIAAAEVARAAPDGYTLLITTNTPHAANVSLYKKLAYDPVKDFAPVARIGTTSFMLMVKADSPIKTFKEFLADARAKPGKLSGGLRLVGLAGLARDAQVDGQPGRASRCPYKGIPLAVTDVLGGTLSFTFVDLGNALAQAKGGKLQRARGHLREAHAARAGRAGRRRGAEGLRADRLVRARWRPRGRRRRSCSGCTTSPSRGSRRRR